MEILILVLVAVLALCYIGYHIRKALRSGGRCRKCDKTGSGCDTSKRPS